MYYLTQGNVIISRENDCTLSFIKEHCSWEKGISLSSIFPSEVFSYFLEEAYYLKNRATYFKTTDNYQEYHIPFYFLLKDDEIIACAAQEIINGKLQEVTINWYI